MLLINFILKANKMNKLLANKLKSTISLESKETDGQNGQISGKPKLAGILGGLMGKGGGPLGGRQ
mgnify:CR=1 FL=1